MGRIRPLDLRFYTPGLDSLTRTGERPEFKFLFSHKARWVDLGLFLSSWLTSQFYCKEPNARVERASLTLSSLEGGLGIINRGGWIEVVSSSFSFETWGCLPLPFAGCKGVISLLRIQGS